VTSDSGQQTGTKDKDYDLISFVEASLSNVLKLETYAQDAEQAGDSEAAELFRKAATENRKGAEIGKKLLHTRLHG